VVYILQ